MAETPRWGLPYPEGSDAPDVPKWMKDLALDLDNVSKDDQGAKASRPAAGEYGRYYYATDEGVLYRDNGTGWNVVRGAGKKVVISTEQSRSATSYGKLTTPDEVTDLRVESGDLLCVHYEALWKFSSAEAHAAIFLNSGSGDVQLKVQVPTAAAQPVAAKIWGEPGRFLPLLSANVGLVGTETSGGADTEAPTTGLAGGVTSAYLRFIVGESDKKIISGEEVGDNPLVAAGGVCAIRGLAAGSYDVSVQFKAPSGTVTAKNRTLRAWVPPLA